MADINKSIEQNPQLSTPANQSGETFVNIGTKSKLLSKLSSLKNTPSPTINPVKIIEQPITQIFPEPTADILPELEPVLISETPPFLTQPAPISSPESTVNIETLAKPTTPLVEKNISIENSEPSEKSIPNNPETAIPEAITIVKVEKEKPLIPSKIIKKGTVGVQNIFDLQEILNKKRVAI